MEFFEPPPLPEHQPLPRRSQSEVNGAPWMGPPANVLAAVAPLRFVVARTSALTLTVTDVCVYGNGFTFKLTALLEDERRASSHRWFHDLSEPLDREGALRPGFLRVGLAFSDGRKATNLRSRWQRALLVEVQGCVDEPTEPLLRSYGGGGSATVYAFDYWAWPLPPPGPLGFVCEWPGEELPLTRHDVDAETILEASTKARVLWGETERFYGAGGSTGHNTIYMIKSEDDEADASSEAEP